MNYGDKQRAKRIFIILSIFICLALIVYFIAQSSYKRQKNLESGCAEYYEHCICIGILTGETISISFKPNENETNYYCQGLEHCWKINETICP